MGSVRRGLERDFDDYLDMVTRLDQGETLAPHVEKVTLAVCCVRYALRLQTCPLPDETTDEIPKIHPADLNYLRDPSGAHNDNLPIVCFIRQEHDKVSPMSLPHSSELAEDEGSQEKTRNDASMDRCRMIILLPTSLLIVSKSVIFMNLKTNHTYFPFWLRDLTP